MFDPPLPEGSAAKPNSAKGRLFPILSITLALALANGVLSVSLVRAKGEIASQSRTVDSLGRAIARKEAILGGYARVIRRQDLSKEPLTGYEVTSKRPWKTDSTPDGVYYVINHRCAACTRNLPFLNSVAALSGASVVGVSYDDTLDLQEYVNSHKIAFPVLANPKGMLASLLPGSLSPVTLIVADGKVRDILLGILGVGEQSVVSEFVRDRTTGRLPGSS